MIKSFKSLILLSFSVIVLYTISLSYEFGTILGDQKNYGLSYVHGVAVNGINISVDYDLYSEGFSTKENYVLSNVKDTFGFDYNISDFIVSAPLIYPIIYQTITRAKYIKEKDSKIRKDIDIIVFGKFEDLLDMARNASDRSVMNDVDKILVDGVADIYNVNREALWDAYRMIPINHEIGHVYFKVENYNRYHQEQGRNLGILSEYAAEHISIIATYADLLSDRRVINKDGAYDALESLMSMIRFYKSSNEHIGATAAVFIMGLKDQKYLIKEKSSLVNIARADERKAIFSAIARTILFEPQGSIPKELIPVMMGNNISMVNDLGKSVIDGIQERVINDITRISELKTRIISLMNHHQEEH